MSCQASRTFATLLSTTQRGTAFEERSLRVLKSHLSMSVRRVGGKSDGGVDLLGWWWLPQRGSHMPTATAARRRLRVLAQCKAEKKKISPKYVRELEGVLFRHLVSSTRILSVDASPQTSHAWTATHPHPVVGLLISESPFTKAAVLRALSSPLPLFLLHFPPVPGRDGTELSSDRHEDWTGTAVWNAALGGEDGLLGGEFEARWERSPSGSGRPGLWWGNEKLRSWIPEGEDHCL